MAKVFSEIIKWGKVKRFDNPPFAFNSIDIETIDNEIFLIGAIVNNNYIKVQSYFYEMLNETIINSVKHNRDIVTWTRYDNTFIVKTLTAHLSVKEMDNLLRNVGRISPLLSWQYKDYTLTLDNIIADNLIFSVKDKYLNEKRLNIYNLKNLFDSDLVNASKDYGLDYYSKLGEEYHLINKQRFINDKEYREKVIEANYLDNRVIIDLADKLINNFRLIAGEYPRTMYTAGSLARAYLLTQRDTHFNISSYYRRHKLFNELTDYAMQSYFGGKIESYVLGYIDKAQAIDITSAYPHSLAQLPALTKKVIKSSDITKLKDYYYAFINCTITITDEKLIHPVNIRSPFNDTNISPIGTFHATITKIEYDYLLKHDATIIVHDYIAVVHSNHYPYKKMIHHLFNERLKTSKTNQSLSNLYKLILNSLYGITYELTDSFDDAGEWIGYRAGDFFNPIIASYITALTRTYLSRVSNNIIENGGQVLLNMTDSIIYQGHVTLDVFSHEKVLGKFENPTSIKDVIILGAGRYEYLNDFTKEYTIKTRGFSAKLKDRSFYSLLDLSKSTTISSKSFVTFFKATTLKYSHQMLGHIIDEDYEINPLNIGGKRIIDNRAVDLKTTYTTTSPVRL